MQSTYEPLQLGEMEAWQWEQIGCELTDPEKLIFSYAAGRYIGKLRKDGYEDHRFKARGRFSQENGHPPHTGEGKQNRFAALLDLTTSIYRAIWPEREQAISKIISSGLNPEIIKEQTEWLLLLKQEQDNLRAAYAAAEARRKAEQALIEEFFPTRRDKMLEAFTAFKKEIDQLAPKAALSWIRTITLRCSGSAKGPTFREATPHFRAAHILGQREHLFRDSIRGEQDSLEAWSYGKAIDLFFIWKRLWMMHYPDKGQHMGFRQIAESLGLRHPKDLPTYEIPTDNAEWTNEAFTGNINYIATKTAMKA